MACKNVQRERQIQKLKKHYPDGSPLTSSTLCLQALPPRPHQTYPHPWPDREFMGCKSCFSTLMEITGKHFHRAKLDPKSQISRHPAELQESGFMKPINVPCDYKPSYSYYDRTVFKFIKRWFLSNFCCLEGPSFFYKEIIYQEWLQNLKS